MKNIDVIFNEIKYDRTNAFEELYENYKNKVKKIAFSIVKNYDYADDITQNVFVKIMSISPELLPTKNIDSWLYSVTKNETINYIKKYKNHIDIENIYEIKESEENPISLIISKHTYNEIINRVDEKSQEIISLKIIGNFTFREISKILDTSIGTVEWKYYKSITSLKKIIANLTFVLIAIILSVTLYSKNLQNNNYEKNSIENYNEPKQEIYLSDEPDEPFINETPSNVENQTTKEHYNIVLYILIIPFIQIVIYVIKKVKKRR